MKCSLIVLFTVLLLATSSLGARLKRQAEDQSPNAAGDVPAKPTPEDIMNSGLAKMIAKYNDQLASGAASPGLRWAMEMMAMKMAMKNYKITPENQAALDDLPQEGADDQPAADQQF